jgi:hypothetical protein
MTGSGFRAGGKLLIPVLQVLTVVCGDVRGIVDCKSSSIMMALKDVFSLYLPQQLSKKSQRSVGNEPQIVE